MALAAPILLAQSMPSHGSTAPRLAPPLPAKSRIAEFRKAARIADIRLLAWQDLAARYMVASSRSAWLYPEAAIVVARQNGKSELLVPRIVMGLLRGERIMHTAQNRELPREIYERVAEIMEMQFAALLTKAPRRANGQEVIRMRDGGRYRIVASNTSGARGYPNDLVIIDELREFPDFDFIGAARPTLTTSKSPQMLYLSNAGEESSVVLNAIRARSEADPELAYLEWSAHPDRPPDDRAGWAEANPALGHLPFIRPNLETAFRQLPLAIFEIEHLCRWVITSAPKIVSDVAWSRARRGIGKGHKPAMGIAVDPNGKRASAVLAWLEDGNLNLRVCADVPGEPIDLDAFAEDLVPLAKSLGVRQVGFDPWTDRDLARFFPSATSIAGSEYAAACDRFARAVDAGQLRHGDSGPLTGDLAYTVRRETGKHWYAVRANQERPTTASFAAIRAVWMATAPKASPVRIY